VVAGDLVGVDAKPVFGQLAQELHWEEMIPARKQYLRRHVRPRGKRPRLFERCAGLIHLVLGEELRGVTVRKHLGPAGIDPSAS
jgi:hypothetical protein